jgi:hypothetical protein
MFYKINGSTDLAVIGKVNNQAPQADLPLPLEDPNLSRNFGFRKIDPALGRTPTPILDPKAKLTDLISTAVGNPGGLIISNKLKTILLRNPHPGIQCFPMTIRYKGSFVKDYWETHKFDFDFRHINFFESTFAVVTMLESQPRRIKDVKEYLDLKDSLKAGTGLSITKLVLKKGIDSDLVVLRGVKGKGYYVSESLKQAIEEANCTGLTFEVVEEA